MSGVPGEGTPVIASRPAWQLFINSQKPSRSWLGFCFWICLHTGAAQDVEGMRRAERPEGALKALKKWVLRCFETGLLVVGAVGLVLVAGVAKLLGSAPDESASGREDAEEIERAKADSEEPLDQ